MAPDARARLDEGSALERRASPNEGSPGLAKAANHVTVLSAVGLGTANVRIEDECERLLRMTRWLRECLEAEMSSGLGTAGKHGVDKNTLGKWEQLVDAFNTLTNARARLDRTVKDSQKSMTPERELEVVRGFIRSMPHEKRGNFLSIEAEFHRMNEQSGGVRNGQ